MVRRSPVRRAVWLLPLTATLALVCALAAFGATTRSSAAPTLVVDNSFTIKTFTFQLKQNVHFADGTSLTSADVVFSMNRLINLKGNPASLLAGITTSA